MGHLAAGPTELREAVSPGALEKDSPDMGGPPPCRRDRGRHLLFSVLAAEGKGGAGSWD